MTLEATVKKSHSLPQVLAFSRHEYVKDEWRDVPEGCEDEAKNHPFLDTREKKKAKAPAKKTTTKKAPAKKTTTKKAPAKQPSLAEMRGVKEEPDKKAEE
jgi:hypothetical protein